MFEALLYFKGYIFSTSVALVRMALFFGFFPLLSKGLLTGLLRNAVMLSLGLILIPLVYPTVHSFEVEGGLLLTALLIKEAMLGFLMAFVASHIFWVAESVGSFIDNQRGANMASMFDLSLGEETSPTGNLLLKLLIIFFFCTGGFLMLLEVLFRSYQIWPIMAFFPKIGLIFPKFFLQRMDLLMTLLVVFAAPVVLVLFFTEFGLGMINRFAQQLNVFSLAMAVKSGVASFLLIIYIHFLIEYLGEELLKIRFILDVLSPILSLVI